MAHSRNNVSDDPSRRRKWQAFTVAAAAVAVLLVGWGVSQRRMEPRPDVEATTQVASNQPAVASAPGKTPGPAGATYDVSASFYASRNGKDVRLTQGSRVRPDDKLFAIINASQPVFVYIINRDEAGQSFLLFPLPGFSPGNPIPTGQMTRFPGTRNGRQIYWNVTSAGGQEHFFLYVTPDRLVEFERLLAALPRAELGRNVSNVALSTPAIGVLRGVGGLSAETSSPTSSTGAELADLQPLSDQNESAAGVWARRVSFQNPAE